MIRWGLRWISGGAEREEGRDSRAEGLGDALCGDNGVAHRGISSLRV